MIEVKTVIAPTDFSDCSMSALPYAWEVARTLEADLILAHACRRDAEVPKAQEQLRMLATTLKPLAKRVVAGAEAPAVFLDHLVRECERPLVVMATHGRRGAARRIMGSVAESVVSRVPCPVLTVSPSCKEILELIPEEEVQAAVAPKGLEMGAVRRSKEDIYFAEQDRKLAAALRRKAREREEAEHGKQLHRLKVKRILVPTDFSARSLEALDYALELAREYGAEVTVLHVLESTPRGVGGLAAEEIARKNLARLAADIEEVPILEAVVKGPAPNAIVKEAAEQEVDLVILATRGHRTVAGVPLGSTAKAVVRRSPCPVLTVKAAGAVVVHPEGVVEAAAAEPEG